MLYDPARLTRKSPAVHRPEQILSDHEESPAFERGSTAQASVRALWYSNVFKLPTNFPFEVTDENQKIRVRAVGRAVRRVVARWPRARRRGHVAFQQRAEGRDKKALRVRRDGRVPKALATRLRPLQQRRGGGRLLAGPGFAGELFQPPGIRPGSVPAAAGLHPDPLPRAHPRPGGGEN